MYRVEPITGREPVDWQTILSGDERNRAEGFKHHPSRLSYIHSRYALRKILARHLGDRPEKIVFRYQFRGKPYLADNPVWFNLSHSGAMALIAVNDRIPVGVDIERERTKTDWRALAKRFFADEEYQFLCRQAEPWRFFYRFWTCKEAYIKALGTGVAYGLDKFAVSPLHGRLLYDCHQPGAEQDWYFHTMEMPDGYHAALADTVAEQPGMIHWPTGTVV